MVKGKSVPVPKYNIGDAVYVAGFYDTEPYVQCPDCLGEKEWSATTPAGETFDVPCGTCTSEWFSTGLVRGEYQYVPDVRGVTVGSIQIDTNDKESQVKYMMIETGVGTGRVYSEDELFDSHEEAEKAASAQCAERNEERRKMFDERRREEKARAKRKPSWDARKVKDLKTALKDIGKFSAAHHSDQELHVLLHALTVDIPAMVDDAIRKAN